MSSEYDPGFLKTLKCKFSKLNITKSPNSEDLSSAKSVKTVADYIHDNEVRLKTRRMPTQNSSTNPHSSDSAETKTSTYVFEKIKHSTIPQLVKSECEISDKDDIDKHPKEYLLESFPSEMRPRTFSMPTQNTYTKPVKRDIQRSHLNLNLNNPLNIERNEKKENVYHKKIEIGLDSFFENEMRARTSSMPTRSLFNKPRIQHLRRSHQNLFTRPGTEIHTVRTFQLNNKGKIVKRSESRSTRSSNSELSLEDDSFIVENISRMSSADGECHVFVRGIEGVGKTALMQQFLTTQYLGGFDTSIGKFLRQLLQIYLQFIYIIFT